MRSVAVNVWRWLVFTLDWLLDLVWDRRPASQKEYEKALDRLRAKDRGPVS